MTLTRAFRSTAATVGSALMSISFALAPHIVGDSTAADVADEIGYGSGYHGLGFVSSADVIWGGEVTNVNPLEAAPSDDLPVVGFVSIWDGLAEDVNGYIEATRAYPQGVIWVEAPPFTSDSGEVDTTLVALNERVAEALGCDLVPWRWREVETTDGVHASDAGVEELIVRMTVLSEFAEPCFGPTASPHLSLVR